MSNFGSMWKGMKKCRGRHFAVLATLVALALVLLRVMFLGGPFIFADEYLYGAWSSALYSGRHGVPPLDVALGNWLYLRVYSLVFVGGGSFLVKARILNTLFSSLAAGVLFYVLKGATQERGSLLPFALAVGAVSALLGTYAGYFIPETIYFAITCPWVLCAIRYPDERGVSVALAAGLAGGLATMVKGHALLLLPATIVAFVFAGLSARDSWRRTVGNAFSLVLAWLASCAAIAMALRNDSDLNPIGGFYGGTASGIIAHLASFLNGDFVALVLRYAATLIVVLGLPLLICFWLAVVAIFRPRGSRYRSQLLCPALMLCCAITGFLLMSSVFTVAAVTQGSVTYDPFHNVERLDGGRYYEVFALLAACLGVMASRIVFEGWSRRVRLTVSICLLALFIGCWWVLRDVRWQNPNDFAIAYGLFSTPFGRWWAFALVSASAVISAVWPKHARVVLTCALLAWLGFDAVRIEQLRWPNQEPAAGRIAALVDAVTDASSSVEIVGPGPTVDVYRTAFHLLNRNTVLAIGSAASKCGTDGKLPDWVITIDGTPDPCNFTSVVQMDGIAAAQRR